VLDQSLRLTQNGHSESKSKTSRMGPGCVKTWWVAIMGCVITEGAGKTEGSRREADCTSMQPAFDYSRPCLKRTLRAMCRPTYLPKFVHANVERTLTIDSAREIEIGRLFQ
jgi:hypothetical protein